jgi:hypothetical protein
VAVTPKALSVRTVVDTLDRELERDELPFRFELHAALVTLSSKDTGEVVRSWPHKGVPVGVVEAAAREYVARHVAGSPFGRYLSTLGLTNERAAQIAGFPRRTLVNWTLGKYVPTRNAREHLEKVFGFPAEAWGKGVYARKEYDYSLCPPKERMPTRIRGRRAVRQRRLYYANREHLVFPIPYRSLTVILLLDDQLLYPNQIAKILGIKKTTVHTYLRRISLWVIVEAFPRTRGQACYTVIIPRRVKEWIRRNLPALSDLHPELLAVTARPYPRPVDPDDDCPYGPYPSGPRREYETEVKLRAGPVPPDKRKTLRRNALRREAARVRALPGPPGTR